MNYISIHIKAFDQETQKIDTSIIIIHDAFEQTFYLYGTRGYDYGYNNYTPYAYTYNDNNIDGLCHFVKLAMFDNHSTLSIDYNNILIPYNEVEIVDYEYLYKKMNVNNEIIAIDGTTLNHIKLKENLSKLFL
jgi:hypothetical protein